MVQSCGLTCGALWVVSLEMSCNELNVPSVNMGCCHRGSCLTPVVGFDSEMGQSL